LDAFTANLSSVAASAQHLLTAYDKASTEAVLRHKNGFKMLVYLLHMITMQAQREADQFHGSENALVKQAAGVLQEAPGVLFPTSAC